MRFSPYLQLHNIDMSVIHDLFNVAQYYITTQSPCATAVHTSLMHEDSGPSWDRDRSEKGRLLLPENNAQEWKHHTLCLRKDFTNLPPFLSTLAPPTLPTQQSSTGDSSVLNGLLLRGCGLREGSVSLGLNWPWQLTAWPQAVRPAAELLHSLFLP